MRSGMVRQVHETRWDDLAILEERHRTGLATREDERALMRMEMGDDWDD